MNVSKCEEWFKLKFHFFGSIHQFISDNHLITVGSQKNALNKNHLSHLVGDFRHRIGLKVHNILVPPWFVDFIITMNTKIKLLTIN